MYLGEIMCLAFKLNSVQLYFFSDVMVLFPPTTEETVTRETTAFWKAETLSGSRRWWLVLFLRVYIPIGNTLGPTLKQNLNSYEEKEDKTKEPDGHRSENCFAAPRVTS